jgi:L-iditol 2-dehydrogenase
VKSLRRAAFRPRTLAGATVYVVGLGVIGLMHVALARHLGARVFGSDFIAARRERAVALGATAAFAPEDALAALGDATAGNGAPIVVCCPGTEVALGHALEAAAPAGTVVAFSPLPPDEPFRFDQAAAYFRDLTLVSSYSCGPDDTAEALSLVAEGVVDAKSLGATVTAFPAVAAAYRGMREGATVKAIVSFSNE